jgi:hypothetical protein
MKRRSLTRIDLFITPSRSQRVSTPTQNFFLSSTKLILADTATRVRRYSHSIQALYILLYPHPPTFCTPVSPLHPVPCAWVLGYFVTLAVSSLSLMNDEIERIGKEAGSLFGRRSGKSHTKPRSGNTVSRHTFLPSTS